MLVGAHKKFERVQHTEIHLLGLKLQYQAKMKLPLDMVSKHVLLYLWLPDYLKRKDMLKPDIAKPYRAVCSKSQAITSYLFGDDLPKHIKEIGEVNKISRRVRVVNFIKVLEPTKVQTKGLF